MKVLLIQDVYKLGRAGDIKKVADGFGRNYLIPQGLAMLATPGALKQADTIRTKASKQRALLNDELSGVAEIISTIVLTFGAKAGETGKLYGSITTQMIADALNKKLGAEKIDRRLIELEPIRALGEYLAQIRLTIDLVPSVKVIVHREGEAPVAPVVEEQPAADELEAEDTAADEAMIEMEAPSAEEESAWIESVEEAGSSVAEVVAEADEIAEVMEVVEMVDEVDEVEATAEALDEVDLTLTEDVEEDSE